MMDQVSQLRDRIKQAFRYCPETGELWRHFPKFSRKCRTKERCGYFQVRIEGKLYMVHRIIWLIMEGHFPEYEVDHQNRCRTDNSWCNLRHVTHSDNQKNKTTNTGTPGISYLQGRGKYQVQWEGKKQGNFNTFPEALTALNKHKKETDNSRNLN